MSAVFKFQVYVQKPLWMEYSWENPEIVLAFATMVKNDNFHQRGII